MRDHHTTLTGRAFEDVNVRSANELFVPRGPQVSATRAKTLNGIWSDVLV